MSSVCACQVRSSQYGSIETLSVNVTRASYMYVHASESRECEHCPPGVPSSVELTTSAHLWGSRYANKLHVMTLNRANFSRPNIYRPIPTPPHSNPRSYFLANCIYTHTQAEHTEDLSHQKENSVCVCVCVSSVCVCVCACQVQVCVCVCACQVCVCACQVCVSSVCVCVSSVHVKCACQAPQYTHNNMAP